MYIAKLQQNFPEAVGVNENIVSAEIKFVVLQRTTEDFASLCRYFTYS